LHSTSPRSRRGGWRLRDFLGRAFLGEYSPWRPRQGAEDVFLTEEPAQHQHQRARRPLREFGDDLKGAGPWHIHVHDDHLRLEPLDRLPEPLGAGQPPQPPQRGSRDSQRLSASAIISLSSTHRTPRARRSWNRSLPFARGPDGLLKRSRTAAGDAGSPCTAHDHSSYAAHRHSAAVHTQRPLRGCSPSVAFSSTPGEADQLSSTHTSASAGGCPDAIPTSAPRERRDHSTSALARGSRMLTTARQRAGRCSPPCHPRLPAGGPARTAFPSQAQTSIRWSPRPAR